MTYCLHFASAVLDPFQVDVAEAGTRHSLQAVHVILINLHTENLRITLNVVPLGVGLQCLLDSHILKPCGQFGRVDQIVDNTLREEREDGEMEGRKGQINEDGGE